MDFSTQNVPQKWSETDFGTQIPVFRNRIQNTPPKRKKIGFFTAVLFFVLAILLAGGGVFAYTNYVSPRIFSEKTADEILKTGITSLANSKSFSFKVNSLLRITHDMSKAGGASLFEGDIPESPKIESNLYILVNGSVDFNQANNTKFSLNNNFSFELLSDEIGAMKTDIFSSIIYLNKILYVSIEDVDFNILPTETTQEEAVEASNIYKELIDTFLPKIANRWFYFDTNLEANDLDLTLSEKMRLKKYVTDANYVISNEKIGVEIIDGVENDKLAVTIVHGDELINILRDISLRIDPSLDGTEELEQDIESFREIVSKPMSFDVWISKQDGYIKKILIEDMVIEIKDDGIFVKSTHEINFDNFNNILPITSPQGAVPIESLVEELNYF